MTGNAITNARLTAHTGGISISDHMVNSDVGPAISSIKTTQLTTSSNTQPIVPGAISIVCRNGQVVMTECTVNSNIPHKYIIRFLYNVGQRTKYDETKTLSSELMGDRICPLLSKGSPSIYFDHTLKQYRINNINPTPITGADIGSANYQVFRSLQSLASMNLPHMQYAESYALLTNQHTLRCKEFLSQTANNVLTAPLTLRYEASVFEVFVCQANSRTQVPQVTIATCGQDRRMHVAPFITEQFPYTITSFGINQNYKCYAPDPVWLRYKYYANAQNITEDQMTLHANIYPAIKKVNIQVTGCKPEIPTEFPLSNCSARILFDTQTVTQMVSKAQDSAALQGIVQNPATQNVQTGDSMHVAHFMHDNALQISGIPECIIPRPPKPQSLDPAIIPVLAFVGAFVVIMTAVVIACCKCGIRQTPTTAKPQANKPRQSSRPVEPESKEAQVAQAVCSRTPNSRTPNSKDKDIRQTPTTAKPQANKPRQSSHPVEPESNELQVARSRTPKNKDKDIEQGTPLTTLKKSTSVETKTIPRSSSEESIYLSFESLESYCSVPYAS